MDILSMYPEYVRLFTRDDYAAAFEKYRGECAGFFAGLREDTVDAAVDSVMDFAGNVLRRKLGRKPRCFDLQCFFCVYLCPAANACGTEAAAAFAERLAAKWSKAYPDFPLEAGNYEDIAKGFRTKPFGIDF